MGHPQARVTIPEVRDRSGVELPEGEEYPANAERPRTRGECVDGPRPCPWVSCRHHLLLEVTRRGSLVLVHGTDDPEALPETCALDVADRGGETLVEVGRLLGVTRERIRQIEERAVAAAGRRGGEW